MENAIFIWPTAIGAAIGAALLAVDCLARDGGCGE